MPKKRGHKVDTINREKMAAQYGFALAFMNSDKELAGLFNQAVKNTWTPQMFAAKLRNTKWFKKNSAPVRNAILQKTSDPATYKANVDKMKSTLADQWGKMYGTTLSAGALNAYAETAYRFGWSEGEAIDHMSKGVDYRKLLRSKSLGGTFAEVRGQLDQLTANYGIGFSDNWKAAQVKRIVEGNGTIGGIQDQVREYAKQQYAAFADQLDAGKTMSEIADPYVQKMSELLEMNPNDLGLKDGMIQKALTMKDQQGRPAAMNLNDFANEVRKDNRWQYTDNAKQQVANTTTQLLSSFGLM